MRHGKPFDCPVCGEDVPANAKSCPECGACEKSGWSSELHSSRLDLPGADFDYDEFVAEEFDGGRKKSSIQWVWWVLALVLFVVLLWGFGHFPPDLDH